MPDERFEQIVFRQSRFVYRVAWAILRNVEDAEDVAQETFLRLYRTGAWERMEDERAFLARTAWRLSVDRIGARARGVDVACDPVSDAVDPERAAIGAGRNAAVHKLISALPEEIRQPLVLSAVDELTSAQIAAAMGISEGTVRTRIMRARQILKQKLASMETVRGGK